jgi:hypothetical protein
MSQQHFSKDWPADFRLKVAGYPATWQRGPISAGGLADIGMGCNCQGNSTVSGCTAGLGACPSTADIYVEDNSIPVWVWIVAAVWGGLMLLKKR